MKKKVYLAVRIIDGKAEASEITKKCYDDFNWRIRMQENAQKGGISIYFTETDINL